MSRLNRDFQWDIRDKQSLLRARLLHLKWNMPGPGIEPPTSGMSNGRANHYTTSPLYTLCTNNVQWIKSGHVTRNKLMKVWN